MIKLSDIYIYPIKSLGGIRVDQSCVLKPGLEYDRRWMLVDLDGNFLSQRSLPKMALLAMEWNSGGFLIKDKLNPKENIPLPLQPKTDFIKKVRIWNDEVEAILVDPAISRWLQSKLQTPCELVFMPSTTIRPIEEKYSVSDESVSFADAMPYLLISQASLDYLNTKLKIPIPMDRFRPNLVVSGTEPFDEDVWGVIQIGSVRFKITKPCARCVMTTVSQESALSGKEPLATLSTFRKVGNNIFFGQNMIPLDEGKIRQDDEVKLIEKNKEKTNSIYSK
jgi:uncharacterized protein YcbX